MTKPNWAFIALPILASYAVIIGLELWYQFPRQGSGFLALCAGYFVWLGLATLVARSRALRLLYMLPQIPFALSTPLYIAAELTTCHRAFPQYCFVYSGHGPEWYGLLDLIDRLFLSP